MSPAKIIKEAPEAQDQQFRDYEMVLIISPEIIDEALDNTIDKISKFVTENGGTISDTERWGKRKLAYPIKHCMEGNYMLTRFRLKPTSCKELESKLQVSEEILRHLLINLGDSPEEKSVPAD